MAALFSINAWSKDIKNGVGGVWPHHQGVSEVAADQEAAQGEVVVEPHQTVEPREDDQHPPAEELLRETAERPQNQADNKKSAQFLEDQGRSEQPVELEVLEVLRLQQQRLGGKVGDLEEGRVADHKCNVDDDGDAHKDSCQGFELVVGGQRVLQHFQERLSFFLPPVDLEWRFG